MWESKLRALVVLVAILGFVSTNAKAQARTILDKTVENVDISEPDIRFAVAELAQLYDAPIGLETSNERKGPCQVLSSRSMTLRAALDQLIAGNPDYKWTFEEGVVNIFPERNRDRLLSGLLEVKIRHFSAPQLVSTLRLRTLLGTQPEVDAELGKDGLKLVTIAFFSTEINKRDFKKPFSFDNRTLREILNELIKRNEVNFWSIARFGENSELVVIAL